MGGEYIPVGQSGRDAAGLAFVDAEEFRQVAAWQLFPVKDRFKNAACFLGQRIDADSLAESLGISTVRARVWNVAVSGSIAALAGAFMMPKIFVITPDLFGVSLSATGLLATILGGKTFLLGPLLGGVLFALLPESLRFVDDARLAIFAVILLLAVRLLPAGVLSLLPRWFRGVNCAPAFNTAALPPLLNADMLATGTEVLRVTALKKSFSGVKATDDVSFTVYAGELVGLIGPSGAGKTTCFNQLSGFLKPDSGNVYFLGQSIVGLAPHLVAKIGLVRSFQHAALFKTLSVYENALVATHLAAPEPFAAALLRLRTTSDMKHAQRAIEGRLLALGRAHDLLLQAQWTSADLEK